MIISPAIIISPQRLPPSNDHLRSTTTSPCSHLPLQEPSSPCKDPLHLHPSPGWPQPPRDMDAGDTLPFTPSCPQPQQHQPVWMPPPLPPPAPQSPAWGEGPEAAVGPGRGLGVVEPLDRWAAETVAPRPAAAQSRSSALAGKRAKFSHSPPCQLCSPAPSRQRGRRAAGLAPSSAFSLLGWSCGVMGPPQHPSLGVPAQGAEGS